MIPPLEYHRPASLPEACALLEELGPGAVPLAGGTDLVVDLRRGMPGVSHLVSLRDLEELRAIRLESGELRVGALVTPALLNASAFLDEEGDLDVAGFSHAATLLTLAMDISLMITAQPTPRLAKRSWDFRPLSLSLTGVAEAIL